jgi:hypothetical protein
MDIDLILIAAFLAFFSLFTALFLAQRFRGRRKSDADKKHHGFYPSAAALGLALLSLQTLAQPDLHHSLEQRQSEAEDAEEDGDAEDPFAQLNRQLKRIRNNEPVDNLQVPYLQSDNPNQPQKHRQNRLSSPKTI